jgi:hypothetical protein
MKREREHRDVECAEQNSMGDFRQDAKNPAR